jgi:exopolyphosphatase/pppGpp-phosphohydrolase
MMSMKMALALAFVISIPAMSSAANCAASTKELNRLRQEYKNYVATASKSGTVSFDELTKILDKIVKVKDEMRANCPIPPRRKPPTSR